LSRHYSYINDPTGFLKKLIRACSPRLPEEALRHAQEEVQKLWSQLKDMIREECKGLAGSHLEEMLLAPEKTASYLTHPDPNLRRAAIRVTGHYWERTPEFVDTCERLIFEDPDSVVRFWALDAWMAYYANTDDMRVGRLLATIVYDSSKPTHFRRRAYYGLFVVRGMPIGTHPSLVSKEDSFSQDVDWSFVDSFLGEKRGTA
jgi:hypothetical protein